MYDECALITTKYVRIYIYSLHEFGDFQFISNIFYAFRVIILKVRLKKSIKGNVYYLQRPVANLLLFSRLASFITRSKTSSRRTRKAFYLETKTFDNIRDTINIIVIVLTW